MSHHSKTRVNNVSTKPLALNHYDIWGPIQVHSVLNFKYFVTFVDDHSRMTWFYLLKERYEFPYVLNVFYQEITTQFGYSIKVFQSDNGLEYYSSIVTQFCVSRRIIHQKYCVVTP